ncbi:hypothetical protein [Dechloromonas sp. HYN0024]|uniref:hypothetical protein n=1 Tax=Dechloromonas sp. HYN0024 TaxID=2231055 RepID=UPI0019671E61|nr:hypothetical protein [Dechloromonas sp. HYN0024]
MRSLIIAAALALTLAACATQTTPPAAAPVPAAVPVAAAPAPAPKAPECYNGDAGKFEAVGTVSSISGVKVVCEKTSDGKNAQWMGVKK